MLYIIGLGLDLKDISLKGLDAVKKCKAVYLDGYTSQLPFSVEELERLIRKKIIIAERKMIEESNEIIESAKKQDAALLIPGDPLAATTHVELLLRAKKEKVSVKIIHASSILTAVAETGLQLYKFGKTASIAKWQKSFRPESFYDVLQENLKINAHTLLLIDIGLSVNEALSYIKEIAEKRKDKSILNKEIIVCEKLGTNDGKITFDKLDKLLKKKFSLPSCIIVPAELHFLEAEILKSFK
jgi:diphthine synthase